MTSFPAPILSTMEWIRVVEAGKSENGEILNLFVSTHDNRLCCFQFDVRLHRIVGSLGNSFQANDWINAIHLDESIWAGSDSYKVYRLRGDLEVEGEISVPFGVRSLSILQTSSDKKFLSAMLDRGKLLRWEITALQNRGDAYFQWYDPKENCWQPHDVEGLGKRGDTLSGSFLHDGRAALVYGDKVRIEHLDGHWTDHDLPKSTIISSLFEFGQKTWYSTENRICQIQNSNVAIKHETKQVAAGKEHVYALGHDLRSVYRYADADGPLAVCDLGLDVLLRGITVASDDTPVVWSMDQIWVLKEDQFRKVAKTREYNKSGQLLLRGVIREMCLGRDAISLYVATESHTLHEILVQNIPEPDQRSSGESSRAEWYGHDRLYGVDFKEDVFVAVSINGFLHFGHNRSSLLIADQLPKYQHRFGNSVWLSCIRIVETKPNLILAIGYGGADEHDGFIGGVLILRVDAEQRVTQLDNREFYSWVCRLALVSVDEGQFEIAVGCKDGAVILQKFDPRSDAKAAASYRPSVQPSNDAVNSLVRFRHESNALGHSNQPMSIGHRDVLIASFENDNLVALDLTARLRPLWQVEFEHSVSSVAVSYSNDEKMLWVAAGKMLFGVTVADGRIRKQFDLGLELMQICPLDATKVIVAFRHNHEVSALKLVDTSYQRNIFPDGIKSQQDLSKALDVIADSDNLQSPWLQAIYVYQLLEWLPTGVRNDWADVEPMKDWVGALIASFRKLTQGGKNGRSALARRLAAALSSGLRAYEVRKDWEQKWGWEFIWLLANDPVAEPILDQYSVEISLPNHEIAWTLHHLHLVAFHSEIASPQRDKIALELLQLGERWPEKGVATEIIACAKQLLSFDSRPITYEFKSRLCQGLVHKFLGDSRYIPRYFWRGIARLNVSESNVDEKTDQLGCLPCDTKKNFVLEVLKSMFAWLPNLPPDLRKNIDIAVKDAKNLDVEAGILMYIFFDSDCSRVLENRWSLDASHRLDSEDGHLRKITRAKLADYLARITGKKKNAFDGKTISQSSLWKLCSEASKSVRPSPRQSESAKRLSGLVEKLSADGSPEALEIRQIATVYLEYVATAGGQEGLDKLIADFEVNALQFFNKKKDGAKKDAD